MKAKIMDDGITIEMDGFLNCECKCTDVIYYGFETTHDAQLALRLLKDLEIIK